MGTSTASFRAIGGLLLAFAGGLMVALGSALVVASIASALQGSWVGHASGVWLLVYGLLLSVPGAFAFKHGLRVYRTTERGSPGSHQRNAG